MAIDLDLFSTPLFILKKLQRNKMRKYSTLLEGRLLDLGCGTGPYKKFISCQFYTGMDENIDVGPDIQGNALQIPFSDNSFNTVMCSEVLEHLKEPRECLAEISRVLCPGGISYITAPMSWSLHYEPNDYWRFTNYSLEYLIKQSGLNVLKIERIGGIFSLLGVRCADVYWTALKKAFSFLSDKHAERISSALTFPISILFYCAGSLFDELDKRDALGWMVLAQKGDAGE